MLSDPKFIVPLRLSIPPLDDDNDFFLFLDTTNAMMAMTIQQNTTPPTAQPIIKPRFELPPEPGTAFETKTKS